MKKEQQLREAADKYSNELIHSTAIKDYEKSWLESVFIYVAKSDAAKQYHSQVDDTDALLNHFGNWCLLNNKKFNDSNQICDVVTEFINSKNK